MLSVAKGHSGPQLQKEQVLQHSVAEVKAGPVQGMLPAARERPDEPGHSRLCQEDFFLEGDGAELVFLNLIWPRVLCSKVILRFVS